MGYEPNELTTAPPRDRSAEIEKQIVAKDVINSQGLLKFVSRRRVKSPHFYSTLPHFVYRFEREVESNIAICEEVGGSLEKPDSELRVDRILNDYCSVASVKISAVNNSIGNGQVNVYQVKDPKLNEWKLETIDTIIKVSIAFDAFKDFLLGGVSILVGTMLLGLGPFGIIGSVTLIGFGIYNCTKGGYQLNQAANYPAFQSIPLDP